MKKILCLVLVFGLGLLLVSGCQQATETTASDIPADTIADGLGEMAKNSLAMDNAILGVVTAQSASGLKAAAPSIPTYGADGWWSSTDNYTVGDLTRDIEYKWKIWNMSGNEMVTLQELQNVTGTINISKIWTYTTIDYTYPGGSYNISYGASTGNPLKFEGYNTASQTISGPLTLSSSYSGRSYSISYTFGNLTVTGSGYPSGTISWSVSANGSEIYAGTITFNGTNTATIAFATGAFGTYSVNLDTGYVTPLQ